jgi:hypothetical protein
MAEQANWWDIYWVSGGSGIVLSKPAVELVKGGNPEKYRGMEDVWLADIMLYYQVPMANIIGMNQYLSEDFDPCTAISQHELSINNMKLLYEGEPIYIKPRMRTREDMPAFFEEKGYKVGVEVGVWEGLFSESILKGCSAKLYSVDPWKEDPNIPHSAMVTVTQPEMEVVYKTCCDKLAPYKNSNIIRKPSVEAAKDFADGSLDFVYIDGLHFYEDVKNDIKAWLPKVRKGGMIGGHDYYEDTWGAAVRRAVDEVFDDVEITCEKRASASWYTIIS